jgi:hypothetical protein
VDGPDRGDQDPVTALQQLVGGYQVSQALHVAATLGIADRLGDGPQSCEDLAAADAHAPTLYRLLRALAAVGVFREEPDRRFALTPLGEGLRTDAPKPVGPMAVHIGQPSYWQAWGHLLHSVRTGENAFRALHGMDVWAYRARHPEAGARFDAAMTAGSRRVAGAVVGAYDFGSRRCVVDIAGGQGALLAAILTRHPHLRGVLFDQPHVVAGAGPVLQAAGVAGRCEAVGGDFFTAELPPGDLYVLSRIIHDWEDEPATALLRNCRRGLAADGRLLLVERVLAPPNEGAAGKFSDLNMLVSPGGRERSRDEFAALLAAAGFRLEAVHPTAADVEVVEAVPA